MDGWTDRQIMEDARPASRRPKRADGIVASPEQEKTHVPA